MVMCFGLDLVITPLQSLVITTITTVHNKWLPKIRSILTELWLAPFGVIVTHPPISSSWRQATWDSRPVILCSNWTLAVIILMLHPLWREGGSVVYNCCRSSPAQPFSGPSPAAIMTIFSCLRFKAPPTWRARSPYLYPPGKGCTGYTPRH
jgi:hypothetical protein